MTRAEAITLREEELATIIETPAPLPPRSSREADPSISSFMGCPIIKPFPAAGGEADIYLIERNGASLVLKLYRFGIAPREDLMQRVCSLGRSFPHCFVPVLEFGYDPSTRRWYELQEYIEGGSLKDLMDGGADPELIDLLLPQLVKALSILHDHRILHLDLKPSNILLRSKEPLQLLLTDFGISSFLDPELSRKLTTVKGTPHYWSPESFTGVVGAEADWWSLGMIILEILQGRHPFSGMDPKLVMFTLSTRGVELGQDIPEPYRTLLMGLLTRRPAMRWGLEQVRRFLGGDKAIPLYYNRETDAGMASGMPFRFMGKEYSEMGDLVAAALTGEEGWNGVRISLEQGHLERWLTENGNQDNALLVRKITQDAGEDTDLALVRMIYQFRPDLPFVMYGKQISLGNLWLFTRNTIRKQGSLAERSLLDDLMKGRLATYYGEFLFLANREPDQLYHTLIALGKLSGSSRFFYGINSDPAEMFKLLEVMVHPESWLLPSTLSNAPQQEAEFLVANHEMLCSKEELQAFLSDHLVPGDLEDALQAIPRLGLEHFRKCCSLLYRLQNEHLLPGRAEFLELVQRYLFPPELSEAITGKRYAPATDAWKRILEWRRQSLLLEEAEAADWLKRNGRESEIMLHQGLLVAGENHTPLDRTRYEEFARDVKCRVIPKLMPLVQRLDITFKEQAMPGISAPCRDIADYINALASRSVPWDETDRRAVKALYEILFVKKIPVPEILGQVLPPRSQGFWHIPIELLAGFSIQEWEPSMKWIQRGAVAGILMGLCFAFSLLFMGERVPVVTILLALLVALLRRSWKLGVPLMVVTILFLARDEMVASEVITRSGRGAAERVMIQRTYFDNISESILDMLLMAWLGILLGARAGEKMGGDLENLTDGERFIADFRARIDVVMGRDIDQEEQR